MKVYFRLFLTLLVFSAQISLCFASNVVWQGSGNYKVVALTFDDGPKPEFSSQILDILNTEGVRATFFVVGQEAEDNIDVIFQMLDFGHEVGNHSYTAETLTNFSRQKIREYLEKTNSIIESVSKKKVKCFRPPGGAFNKVVLEEAGRLGLTVVCWTINASDYIQEYSSFRIPDNYEILAGDLVKKVLDQAKPGAIILFHNGSAQTIIALPEIIRTLRARGYGFVTVSELLDLR